MPTTKKNPTTTDAPTKKPRTRRTPEQIVADLEAKIADVKKRAAAKEAKAAPEGKLFMAAVKATDKALDAARESGNEEMVHALETARAALGEQLVRMGVRAPETRKRKGEAA